MWLAYFVDAHGKVENLGATEFNVLATELIENDIAKKTSQSAIRSEKIEGDSQLRYRITVSRVVREPDGYIWSGQSTVVDELMGWYGVMEVVVPQRPFTPTPVSMPNTLWTPVSSSVSPVYSPSISCSCDSFDSSPVKPYRFRPIPHRQFPPDLIQEIGEKIRERKNKQE